MADAVMEHVSWPSVSDSSPVNYVAQSLVRIMPQYGFELIRPAYAHPTQTSQDIV